MGAPVCLLMSVYKITTLKILLHSQFYLNNLTDENCIRANSLTEKQPWKCIIDTLGTQKDTPEKGSDR